MANEQGLQEDRAADCPLKINLAPVKRMVEETRTKILSSTLIRVDANSDNETEAPQDKPGQ